MRKKIAITVFLLAAITLTFFVAFLLCPEPNFVNAEGSPVADLFTDYTECHVNPEYDSDALNALRQSLLSDPNYSEYEPYLDRAEDVLNGKVRFDPRREFSTEDGSENEITQYGGIRTYCRATLGMSRFGSDRQPTGIYGMAGDAITVYVESEGDVLPSIYFTQFEGSSSSFTRLQTLSKGRNVLTFPNMKNAAYSKEVPLGGAIHIYNPYTEEQQPSDVKIYIEGGDFYPLFKKNGDETAYKNHLAEFCERVRSDSNIPDMTELVADHLYFTVSASACYREYVTNGHSVNDNLLSWDNYMVELLEFGGVTFDENDKYYDEKNEHINCNIRDSQNYPGGAAYAGSDHIGIYKGTSWENIAIYVGDGTQAMARDWGFAHEIGHMLDTSLLEIAETTNNMYSKYAEMTFKTGAVAENQPTHDHFAETFGTLSNDDRAAECFFDDESERYNYFIWWYLEAAFPGFWGRLQNHYRYDYRFSQMTTDEVMVYFSSLSTGIDLSYYFQRWGYKKYVRQNAFNAANTTEEFRSLMQAAVKNGDIDGEYKPKLWYEDGETYERLARKSISLTDDVDSLYHGTEPCEILKVSVGHTGVHTIKLRGEDDERFLGYEITEVTTGKVVGFTFGNLFTDETSYATSPIYRAVAYDIYFRTSAESPAASAQSSGKACRIDDRYYDTFAEAVTAANNGDTVYLLDDIIQDGCWIHATGLTVTPDPSVDYDICFLLGGSSPYVCNDISFIGRENARIVFDASGRSQAAAIIQAMSGDFTAEYVTFSGGSDVKSSGIYSMGTNRLTCRNCRFENCLNYNGGAVWVLTDYTVSVFENCVFEKNKAEQRSGKNGYGGAIYTSGAQTTVDGCIFKNNTAKQGGAIYKKSGKLTINNTEIVSTDTEAALSLNGGSTSIRSDCRINVKIASSETLTLTDGIFPSDATFQFDVGAEPLFESENFEFTPEQAKELGKSVSGGVRLTDGKIYAGETGEFDVTFGADGETVHCSAGVLEIDWEKFDTADKYVLRFTDRNGNAYERGEPITVDGDLTLTAEYAEKVIVTLILSDGEREEKIVPGEYYLPYEDGVIFWRDGATLYVPNSRLNIESDSSYSAVYRDKFYVEFRDNDEVVFQTNCDHNETVIAPDLPDGENWIFDGRVYVAGRGIKVVGDMIFEATNARAPLDFSLCDVLIDGDEHVYDGAEFRPSVTVTYDGRALTPDVDYTVAYFDNVNAGRAFVVITATGDDFVGKTTLYFTIEKAPEPPFGDREIDVPSAAETLSDVTLSNGWEWTEPSRKLTGGTMTATAVYRGSDSDNYENTTITVTLNVEPKPDPDPEPEPSPEPEPKPEPEPEPEPDPDEGDEGDEGDTSDSNTGSDAEGAENNPQKGETNIWVWLIPVIAAAAVGTATIFATIFIVIRKRNNSAKKRK